MPRRKSNAKKRKSVKKFVAPGPKWMTVSEAATYEAEAARKGVSAVARSPRGFFAAYKRLRFPAKMATEPVPGYPNQTWAQRRAAFVARHLEQYRQNPTERRRLALIMWAYMPA